MTKLEDLMIKVPLKTKVRIDIEFYFLEKYGGTIFMPADESSQEYKDALKANTINKYMIFNHFFTMILCIPINTFFLN